MNKLFFKKIFAITGIVLTILHMTFYFYRPYDFFYFMAGFGIIYVVFVLGLKKLNKEK